MSNAVSAVSGASFTGAITVKDAGLRGMITLRGDLSSEALGKAVKSAVGLTMPANRQVRSGSKGSVAWMSPDELLLMVPYVNVDGVVSRISKALKDQHHLCVNVSDARAVFTLEGRGVREVIAKGAPADLSVQGLPIGEIRRSRVGLVAAAFWLNSEQEMELVCFRSVGQYMFDWLSGAAEKGSLPGYL